MNRLFTFLLLSGILLISQDLAGQYEGNSPFCRQGGGLFINEISNGPTTGQNSKEYVELVVTPDPTAPLAPVDLEGWILDDNNVAASGEGNAAGHFVLGACYQAVPPGSILVIYNPDDRNPALPPDDPTDADQDGTYIIPANDPCIQSCNSNPTTDNANYCPCSQPDTPSSAWQIGLRNDGDLFQVRDACETVVHAISWGSLQVAPDVQNSPTYFRLNGDSQSGLVIRFTHTVNDDWNNPANYDNPGVSTGESPGVGNNAANVNLITTLRLGAAAACTGLIYDCKLADAGDLQAPDGLTDSPIVLCSGDDLGAFTAVYDQPDENEPFAPGFTYEYAFLLTDDQEPEYPILDFNSNGDFDFSTLPEGNYRLWGYSYIQTNGSIPLDGLLTNVAGTIQILRDYSSCGFDSDLDSLNQMGQIVEIQIVTAPEAVTPDAPLQACTDDPTAVFDLTTYDDLIADGSTLPVVWYEDQAAGLMIADPTNFSAGATTVYARLESGDCTSNLVPVDLEIGGGFSANIVVDQAPDCDNPLATLRLEVDDPTGLDIRWNFSEWNGQTLLTNVAPGTYSVTVTDPTGCRVTTSTRVNPGGTAIAEYQVVNPTCIAPSSGVIRLNDVIGGSGPFEVSVNGSDFEPANGWQAAGLDEGNYTVVLRDGTGCETAQSVSLQLPAGPVLDLGPDLEIEEGESVFITPTTSAPLTNLNWTPPAGIVAENGGLTIQPVTTTTYTFTITGNNGCTSTASLTVTVTPPDMPPPPPEPSVDSHVFIPNAFSPNEDGVNDIFNVFGDETVALVKSMRVFDRWGNLLYENQDILPNDLQQGWNGRSRINGQPMTTGMYIYFVEVEYVSGKSEVLKGELMLMR